MLRALPGFWSVSSGARAVVLDGVLGLPRRQFVWASRLQGAHRSAAGPPRGAVSQLAQMRQLLSRQVQCWLGRPRALPEALHEVLRRCRAYLRDGDRPAADLTDARPQPGSIREVETRPRVRGS